MNKRIFVLIYESCSCSCCGQMFNYIGIEYSSPTLASAMIDLTPGFTFLLAVISRFSLLSLFSFPLSGKTEFQFTNFLIWGVWSMLIGWSIHFPFWSPSYDSDFGLVALLWPCSINIIRHHMLMSIVLIHKNKGLKLRKISIKETWTNFNIDVTVRVIKLCICCINRALG